MIQKYIYANFGACFTKWSVIVYDMSILLKCFIVSFQWYALVTVPIKGLIDLLVYRTLTLWDYHFIPRLSIKQIEIGGLRSSLWNVVICNSNAILSEFYTIQNVKIATSSLMRSDFYKLTILKFKLHRLFGNRSLSQNMVMKLPSLHDLGRYNPRKNAFLFSGIAKNGNYYHVFRILI